MTPGPPPLPLEVKRRRGTLRADRVGGKGRNIAPAQPLEPLDAVGRTPLEALELVLNRGASWLAETDLVTVVLLRDVLEFAADLREDARANPSDVLAAYKLALSIAGSLGFTPADRSKLGLAEVRAESKLDEMRRRSRPEVTDA